MDLKKLACEIHEIKCRLELLERKEQFTITKQGLYVPKKTYEEKTIPKPIITDFPRATKRPYDTAFEKALFAANISSNFNVQQIPKESAQKAEFGPFTEYLCDALRGLAFEKTLFAARKESYKEPYKGFYKDVQQAQELPKITEALGELAEESLREISETTQMGVELPKKKKE